MTVLEQETKITKAIEKKPITLTPREEGCPRIESPVSREPSLSRTANADVNPINRTGKDEIYF